MRELPLDEAGKAFILSPSPLPPSAPPRRNRFERLRRVAIAAAGIALALAAGTRGTQDAVANGDTRTLSIFHTHTKESATITFKRDGRYDKAALEQLNWLLRDWRVDEPIKMDPRLFDTVWEAYRSVGSSEAIHVVSAYRSPGTNGMLRRRSRAVAEFSQHMLGKAMDFYIPDASIDQIRAIGMRMQRGGVGWYPRSGSPFVHLDVGSVRSWPRMSHDQLARLFPDGRTVHLPTDNHPLPGYEMAKAEILSRGGSVAGVTQFAQAADEDEGPSIKGFFASLFGGGSGEPPAAVAQAPAKARAKPTIVVASADPDAALAYAAPAATETLRASLLRREGRDARSLLTAEAPKPDAAPEIAALAVPLPPRRPSEFAAIAAALAMPLPPARPSVQVAGLGNAGLGNAGLGSAGLGNAGLGNAGLASSGMANVAPARIDLAAVESDPRAQLRALFAAAAAKGVGEPASRAAPVRLAIARAKPGDAPDGLVAEAPASVASRFSSRSPGDDLAASRFSGSATRAVPGAR